MPFDFGRNAVALLGVDGVVVDLFIQHDAVDRAIQRHRLGMLELVVRLDLSDLRQRPDAERAKIAQSGRGAHAQGVNAQAGNRAAILSFALNEFVVHRRERRDFDAGRIEQQLLGIAEPIAAKGRFDFRAALEAVGRHAREFAARRRAKEAAQRHDQDTRRCNRTRRVAGQRCSHRLPAGDAKDTGRLQPAS